jgi:dihydropyrimidinase
VYDLVLRNGRVVSPGGVLKADVGILDGRIDTVGTVSGPADRVIDATGRYVLPGGVDPHMHVENDFLGLSTANDFFTQSVAAVFGGVTTMMDFANAPAGGSLLSSLDLRREQMAKSAIDYAVHGRVLDEGHVAELPEAVIGGCPSFKVYLTYPDMGLMADDSTVLAAFGKAAGCGALPMVHAESDPIASYLIGAARREGNLSWSRYPLVKPPACEMEAFSRAVRFARVTGCPLYIVHTTVGAALDCARRARNAGMRLYVETCPQYLFLDRSIYNEVDRGLLAICSPPLRDRNEAAALWRGLADGTIDTIGSDDCAYTRASKEALLDRDRTGAVVQDFTKVVQGVPAIETRLPLLLSEGVAAGRISIERVAALTSTNPARCFGLYPRKGVVRPGSDADLVLVDPSAERTLSADILHTPVEDCLYSGLTVRGWPVMTIAGGRILVEDGAFMGERGAGRFLWRAGTTGSTR